LTGVEPPVAVTGKGYVQVGSIKATSVMFNVLAATNQPVDNITPPATATGTPSTPNNPQPVTTPGNPAPTNHAPTVNAGPDQIITLPSAASLLATVSDDGLPTGVLKTAWGKVSGPGSVTFSNVSSVSTMASFSNAGTYTLR